MRKGQRPLTVGHARQHLLHQVHRRHLRPLCVTGRAHPSSLAREGDEQFVLATLAAHPRSRVPELRIPGPWRSPAPRTGAGRVPTRLADGAWVEPSSKIAAKSLVSSRTGWDGWTGPAPETRVFTKGCEPLVTPGRSPALVRDPGVAGSNPVSPTIENGPEIFGSPARLLFRGHAPAPRATQLQEKSHSQSSGPVWRPHTRTSRAPPASRSVATTPAWTGWGMNSRFMTRRPLRGPVHTRVCSP